MKFKNSLWGQKKLQRFCFVPVHIVFPPNANHCFMSPHVEIFSFSEGNRISGGPRSKLDQVINCFVWWAIFESIAGQGQAHKSLKDEPVDCGLSCQGCCPGDHRGLPVEVSPWIKSHYWHAEGWSSLELEGVTDSKVTPFFWHFGLINANFGKIDVYHLKWDLFTHFQVSNSQSCWKQQKSTWLHYHKVLHN